MVTGVMPPVLAFGRPAAHNRAMDSSGAISAAVSGLNAGGTGGAIAVSLLKSTQALAAQEVATLFSSIGLGASVNALA
jgi:hypothetical protein